MRVYFFAERSSALFINGEFLGRIGGAPRWVELYSADENFIQITPNGEFLSVNFFLGEELGSLPQNVTIYRGERLLVIYVREFYSCLPFQTLSFFHGGVVYLQGKVFLALEKSTVPLSFDFLHCSLEEKKNVTLLRGEGSFCAVANGKVIYNGKGKNVKISPDLGSVTAEIPLFDCLGRVATAKWEIKEGEEENALPQLTLPPLPRECEAIKHFLPLVVLQQILFHGEEEILPYLSGITPSQILSYVGEYENAFPVPVPNGVGVVEKTLNRIKKIRVYQAEVKEGKMVNLRRIE